VHTVLFSQNALKKYDFDNNVHFMCLSIVDLKNPMIIIDIIKKSHAKVETYDHLE
jgi:hypothetical protein